MAGMEVVYGPSSMGTTVTKADLAINAAKGSTGQQTETNAELTCFNIPHRNQLPTWWQVDDTGPFYSGRGSCSSGLELTHILGLDLLSLPIGSHPTLLSKGYRVSVPPIWNHT